MAFSSLPMLPPAAVSALSIRCYCRALEITMEMKLFSSASLLGDSSALQWLFSTSCLSCSRPKVLSSSLVWDSHSFFLGFPHFLLTPITSLLMDVFKNSSINAFLHSSLLLFPPSLTFKALSVSCYLYHPSCSQVQGILPVFLSRRYTCWWSGSQRGNCPSEPPCMWTLPQLWCC